MSRNKHTSKKDKNKLFVRLISLILALLMIGGLAYYTIYLLTLSVGAEDADEENKIINTSSLKDSEDVLISVGLMYGSNITTGFQTTTEEGYIVGIQNLYGSRDFDEIWEIYTEKISCTADSNLSKNYMTFLIAENRDETVIGGYHIQIDCDMYDREEVEDLISDKQQEIWDLGLYIIPSYIYTGYALRIGDFVSWNQAEQYIDEVESVFDDEIISIVSPTETAVSVLDPERDIILFEYDCGGDSELGLKAIEDDDGNTYIKTPAANIYDGVFCFKRYDNGETDGVSLINILPLEAYIAGVLPYEVSNAWPIETLKAFAITVRSFTLTHLNKHSKYNFDLCNTVDCQVYKGAGRINDNVFDAVLDTSGQVMTYDDNIVTAYYSSSTGGVTVSSKDAWGGNNDIPYLKAVSTPWENYMVHNNAFWITEISPSDLCDRLNEAGYDELEGDIESVEIVELAENSTYIKILKVTDEYGNSAVIKNTDKVRTSLTPHVKSSNFVVGKGSVEYSENVIIEYDDSEEYENVYNIMMGGGESGYDKDYGYIDLDSYYVRSSSSIEYCDIDDSVSILTADGEIEHKKRDIFVISKQNTVAFLGDEYSDYIQEEIKDDNDYVTSVVENKSNDEVTYKIAYAEDEDNFIFVGKGWGHGVGMSQYGARDLAVMGYSAEDILSAYFADTEIIDYLDSDNFN